MEGKERDGGIQEKEECRAKRGMVVADIDERREGWAEPQIRTRLYLTCCAKRQVLAKVAEARHRRSGAAISLNGPGDEQPRSASYHGPYAYFLQRNNVQITHSNSLRNDALLPHGKPRPSALLSSRKSTA